MDPPKEREWKGWINLKSKGGGIGDRGRGKLDRRAITGEGRREIYRREGYWRAESGREGNWIGADTMMACVDSSRHPEARMAAGPRGTPRLPRGRARLPWGACCDDGRRHGEAMWTPSLSTYGVLEIDYILLDISSHIHQTS